MKRALLLFPLVILLLAFTSCTRSKPYQRPIDKKNITTTRPYVAPQDVAVVTPAPTPKPIDRSLLIVIDPGHGGKDFGCESFLKPKALEKQMALHTSILVSKYLKKIGYKTVLTRKDDIFIPLKTRAEFANLHQSTLFVSVHYNSAQSRDAQGVEVFYYKSDDLPKRSASSKQLAGNVLDSIIKITQAKSRGVKHGNFAVIRETKMPAILIEAGFLTNDEEATRLGDPGYQKRLSYAIAQGIHRHLSQEG